MGGWRGELRGEVEFDFHDFSHAEAEGLGAEVVRAAWERGCPFVVLSHGAGDVPTSGFSRTSPVAASSECCTANGAGVTSWTARTTTAP